MSPSNRAEVSPAWMAAAMAATEPDPWVHGFTIFDRASGAAIGNCAFKGPPDDGRVEIAYGVDESHRCRGYATEAALALTGYACTTRTDVLIVQAHTLPEENASTRVLRKSGFRYVGEVVDPEDGLVWRWEYRRSRPRGVR
jgi:RimJ/RimL family protein N-acetyltransferase